MKDSCEVTVGFISDDVTAVLDAAWKEGLLCGTCMQKLSTQEVMRQSDFCPACQAAVNSLLAPVLERRMQEALVRMGLNPDWVEITKNQAVIGIAKKSRNAFCEGVRWG